MPGFFQFLEAKLEKGFTPGAPRSRPLSSSGPFAPKKRASFPRMSTNRDCAKILNFGHTFRACPWKSVTGYRTYLHGEGGRMGNDRGGGAARCGEGNLFRRGMRSGLAKGTRRAFGPLPAWPSIPRCADGLRDASGQEIARTVTCDLFLPERIGLVRWRRRSPKEEMLVRVLRECAPRRHFQRKPRKEPPQK